MIVGFAPEGGRLRAVSDSLGDVDRLVWIDLLNPTADEETTLEAQLGVDVPTREEMQRLEVSGRLYKEDDALVMTAILPARGDSDDLLMSPVTFVLVGGKLVTVRYHEPRVFKTFPQRAAESNVGCASGETVFVALLEATIDRMTDILERAEEEVDAIRATSCSDPPKSASRDLMNTPADHAKATCAEHPGRGPRWSASRFGQELADRTDGKELRRRVKTPSTISSP
jgi:Mg2+ and Co2+ transporter CorA